MAERRSREHVPEEGHGKVLHEGPDPDRRKICGRLAGEDDIEEDRCDEAHRGTHDSDGPRLPHHAAEVRIIFGRIGVPLRKCGAKAVAVQTRCNEDEDAHVRRLDQCTKKDLIGHGGEAADVEVEALLNGDVVHLHSVGHGVAHEQAEYDSLGFVLWHCLFLPLRSRSAPYLELPRDVGVLRSGRSGHQYLRSRKFISRRSMLMCLKAA